MLFPICRICTAHFGDAPFGFRMFKKITRQLANAAKRHLLEFELEYYSFESAYLTAELRFQ